MSTKAKGPRISKAEYGSDVIAEAIRDLGIEYVALNPGASYRGIHDSFVNYLGNERPEMILCNHEEIAVAIAHGYGWAAGKPMAAFVHDIVGLLHASMAMFNALGWAARSCWSSAPPAQSMLRIGAHGSTGSTPPTSRARLFATS